jgi:putative salt-induced outer membrane protein
MTDTLALSFGYGIRYNTDPSPGSKRTDQLTTVNVVYNIK